MTGPETAPVVALVGSPDALTLAVADALRAAGREPLLCVLTEMPEPREDRWEFRVEQVGSLLSRLRGRGVAEACFVGRVGRPRVDPAAVDAATLPLVPRLLAALREGDDGALRAAVAVFEEAGLAVRGAHEIAPSLLPPAGVASGARPTPAQVADAARAEAVHRILSPADIGQGVVVRAGQVVAVEAQPGTDWMLRSVRGVADGALFYKAPKLGQDRRVDLPVIGPATLEGARAAGLGAVVVEAGGVMVLRPDACAALADEAGMVLWVREAGEGQGEGQGEGRSP